jgi:hypothetical protein
LGSEADEFVRMDAGSTPSDDYYDTSQGDDSHFGNATWYSSSDPPMGTYTTSTNDGEDENDTL